MLIVSVRRLASVSSRFELTSIAGTVGFIALCMCSMLCHLVHVRLTAALTYPIGFYFIVDTIGRGQFTVLHDVIPTGAPITADISFPAPCILCLDLTVH